MTSLKQFLTGITALSLMGLIFFNGCKKDEKDEVKNVVYDIDGNEYGYIKVGNRYWMTENLKSVRYNDSTFILPLQDDDLWMTDTYGAYCIYNNDMNNINTYGLLYNWYAVNSGKLAPKGWRVPTEQDWQDLEIELGIAPDSLYKSGYRGTNEGSKLAGSASLWKDSLLVNNPAFDSLKFNAVPGGRRVDQFLYKGEGAFFWTSSEEQPGFAYRRMINYGYTSISKSGAIMHAGLSVRCVTDSIPATR